MHERDRLAHMRESTGPMDSEYLQVFHGPQSLAGIQAGSWLWT